MLLKRICGFKKRNWIFLICCLHLFTYAQGGEDTPSDYGIRFTAEPSDAVVGADGSTILACAAASRSSIARLSWRHSASAPPTADHTLSTHDKHRRQLQNGSLLIEHMNDALAGQYQCVATIDSVGTIVSRVASVFLAQLPELQTGPRSVLGIVGGPALLQCGIKTPPRLAVRVLPATAPDRRVYNSQKVHTAPPTLKLNVTWLQNGSPVALEAARVTVTPSGALEFDPLRSHDASSYSCRVSLAHSPSLYVTSEAIELRVSTEVATSESPPRFIATPQPITVMEGASVTFDCAAVGNPKPEMIWLNNGVGIDLSDLDSRFYLVGSGSLRVQSARALDSGAYTCRAHNKLDSADHTASLHVMTLPRVHLPNGPVATARTRGDVTLRCEVRGRPQPVVVWLKDGEPLTPNNHDIAMVDGSSLRIQGVLKVDAGMFQCVATSPAGYSVASVRLIVLSAEDDFDSLHSTVLPPKINSKSFLTSLKSDTPLNLDPQTLQAPESPLDSKPYSNSTQDIFNSLVTVEDGTHGALYPDEVDTLGETAPAFTPRDDYEYDTLDDFHAAEGTDLSELRRGNATVVSAPKDLRAVIVKHRFVTLSWNEPEHKTEDVTGYAVVYRLKGSERERVAKGSAHRHEMNIAGLQPNSTYLFSVLAHTEHAISPPTGIMEVTTLEEEHLHTVPLNIRVEPMGPHMLKISWSPLPRVENYTVRYTELESGREQVQYVEVDPLSSVVSSTLSGLRAASTYIVVVSASGGEGGAEVQVRTPSDVPSAPPTNVTATAQGATSIVVRWDPPASRTHRGPLTGYKVRYRALPSGSQTQRKKAESLTTPADARRAELKGLDPLTTYQIRVCAINSNGSGPFSEWVTATTLRPRAKSAQTAETTVPSAPPSLTTRAGRDWISVWWSGDNDESDDGALIRGYWLGWGLGVPDEHQKELPENLHSFVIRGLDSNSEYVISLRASNALGLGPPVYATVRTKPPAMEGDELDEEEEQELDEDVADDDDEDEEDSPPLIPPVGLKVIMLSGTTAVVYWTDPTLPKGQTATDGRRYVVRWSWAGGRTKTYNATDLNCMIDDLKPYTQYEFSVKLIKSGRESAWSMLVSNTTLEAAPSTAPRDVSVTSVPPAARSVELSWSPPAKSNGVITGYVIMYAVQQRSGAAEEWIAVSVAGERTRARVDRLRSRTAYSFKVQARNSKGLGPFSQIVHHTTAMETGEGGGLASATSAWLWASAGGACAVLALAAALALSLCCRRQHPPTPDTSTYQKSSASAALKPPDLWIHHDQMELKHMDKSLHSSASKISAGSVEGGSGLVSSTLTLRAPPAEYEPARHNMHPPASLDRRLYVPTYVDRRSPSCSDETAILRASPVSSQNSCRCQCYKPMGGVGVGMGVGCSSTCDRRQMVRHHPDQSTPLLSSVAPPLGSPQSSLGSMHPPPAPCGSGTCPLGSACSVPTASSVSGTTDIYACAARERGHYVAYEPLGHYTHSESEGAGHAGMAGHTGTLGGSVGGSLQRRPPAAPLHSFTLSDSVSNHSSPSHKGSVRETSPYKKSNSSSPGHIPNRLNLGGTVSHCSEELEPLTPSRSTERLHREMQNLEGLMKDLSAITQHQFNC